MADPKEELDANDGSGNAGDVVQNTYNPQSSDFQVSDTRGTTPLTVHFSNTSPNPTGYLYAWDFGDGSVITRTQGTATATHVYNQAGVYTAKLTLYDDDTFIAASTKTIVVAAEQAALTPSFINIMASPTEGSGLTKVQFSVSSMQIPSTAVVYEWDFGNGVKQVKLPGQTLPITAVYGDKGTFVATLTAYAQSASQTGLNVGTFTNLEVIAISNGKTIVISDTTVEPPPTVLNPTQLRAAGHSFSFSVNNRVLPPVGQSIDLDVQVEAFGSNIAQNVKKTFKIKLNRIPFVA